MTTATQPETRRLAPATSRGVKRLPAHLLKALHAEWRKVSPNLDSDLDEREVRLQWTNQRLGYDGVKYGGRLICSWSDLAQGEARRLLKIMRDELGESPLNDYIARAAVRLWGVGSGGWGVGWNAALAERIAQRFYRGPEIAALEFWQKKALFEELVRRIVAAEQVPGSGSQVPGDDPETRSRQLADPSPDGHPTPETLERVRMEIVREKL